MSERQAETSEIADSKLVEAFGLLPRGRYLMTSSYGGHRDGLIVSSLLHCCDEPNVVCVAAKKGHRIDSLIRDSRSFAVGVLESEDRMIQRKFQDSGSTPPAIAQPSTEDPFEGFETVTMSTGSPLLMRCATWFDCEVMRRVDLESDTELFVGLVLGVMHKGEKMMVGHQVSGD